MTLVILVFQKKLRHKAEKFIKRGDNAIMEVLDCTFEDIVIGGEV